MQNVKIIDSHTGGEPTRTVVAGGPDLGTGSLAERKELFRSKFDPFRRSVILEPRGHDVIVGALLVPPTDPMCVAGVIFFNNTGYLNMCGHGTIGVAVTLGHMGKIKAGRHLLETPVGIVPFDFDGRNESTLQNVPSYRHAKGVSIEVEGKTVTGDVSWGGNWFFLTPNHKFPLTAINAAALTQHATNIKDALHKAGVTGRDGGEIDHIELVGPAVDPGSNARNFVLCPGNAYDRSPCGTGTSAKIACLAADGKLKPGELWRQESVIGSVFEGWYDMKDGHVIPSIRGTAYVTAETTLLFDDNDPFINGI